MRNNSRVLPRERISPVQAWHSIFLPRQIPRPLMHTYIWPAASVQQASSYRRLAGQGHTFEQRNFLQLEAVRVAEANYDSETAVAFSNPYSSVGIDFVAGHFNGQSMPSNARVSVYLRADGNEEEVVLLAEEQGAAWGEIELRRTDGKAIEQLRFALSTSKLDTASSTVYCFIYKMVMTA